MKNKEKTITIIKKEADIFSVLLIPIGFALVVLSYASFKRIEGLQLSTQDFPILLCTLIILCLGVFIGLEGIFLTNSKTKEVEEEVIIRE